ncbi:chemotaxis protein CheW [Haloferax sp. YSMS24]|uniref:chemotaxis protein CheW n=1 Tax=unclassified Haloferax TaxID=2625095 RepID=UPI00398D2B59
MSEQSPEFDEGESVSPESVIEFLEFRLHGDRYALELGRVAQVIRKPATTRVPNAPEGIYGSMTVEGDVVVAVDTYAVVGQERPFADPENAYLVLLDRDDTPQPTGLLVETVDGIERHHVESVVPPTEGGTPLDDRWFRAAITDGDGPDIHVFDSHQLIAALHPADTH